MAEFIVHYLPVVFSLDAILVVAHLVFGTDPYWNLDKEHNFPTWFSGVQLAFLGLAALECYRRERLTDRRFFPSAGAWAILTVVFFYLSVDEVTVLHEGMFRNEIRDLLPPDSLWISLLPWQILLGPPLAVVAGLLLLLFLTRFAGSADRWIPAGAGLGCWGVAVLAEGLAKPLFMARGWYRYEVAVEEGLEMFGATLLWLALCRHSAALGRDEIPALDVSRSHRRLAVALLLVAGFITLGATLVISASLQSSGWLYRHNARQLQKRGRDEAAIVAYRKAIEQDPANVSAWSGLALSYYRREDYPAALEAYDQALAIRGGDARLWRHRGAVLDKLGRLEEAEASYRRAVELRPRDARALSYLGIVLEKQGRLEEAIASYQEALRWNRSESSAARGLRRLTE